MMATASTPTRETVAPMYTSSVAITEAQKQALMDNLQLEVTERARKLRAQYALQAQNLRSRLEMRVNRIPQSLRKANMQELVESYSKPAVPKATEASPQRVVQKQASPVVAITRGVKRPSDVFVSSDKENANPSDTLENPKKRTKPTVHVPSGAPATLTATQAIANSKFTRTVSHRAGPGTVLSPKSNNSRTFPQSPLKAASPTKMVLPRPISPIKSAVPVQAKMARPASRQMKRSAATAAPSMAPPPAVQPAPEKANEVRGSSASDSSAGTTVHHQPAAAKKAPPKAAAARAAPKAPPKAAVPKAPAKATEVKSRTGTIRSAIAGLTGGKKAAAAKKEAAAAAAVAAAAPAPPAPVAGGRVLRKRG